MKKLLNFKNINSFRLIVIGFILLILTGSLLLKLPFASVNSVGTDYIDCLFTAVSASCVTGLVVRDTATYWTLFGQFVILILIQIGGMGVVTMMISLIRLSGRKVSLRQRSTFMESVSAPALGGIVNHAGFIIKGTVLVESVGALCFAPGFIKEFGLFKGIWYSVFHSVSAFCNAGFDLMGVKSGFSSLTSYSDNITVNITVMMLIITGGIGFITWTDIIKHKFNFKKYRLQSKIALSVTVILIFLPAILFYIFEFSDHGIKEGILASLFQSVTMRTAGFNTVDLTEVSQSGQLIMIILMLIGGCPGSTAGGMKTTTLFVLFATALSVFRKKDSTQAFNRRISHSVIRNSVAILILYMFLFSFSGIIISRYENIPLLTCLFETASAVGTVGITLGITTSLSVFSKLIIIVLMFMGRVGGLTLIYSAMNVKKNINSKYPLEKVAVG